MRASSSAKAIKARGRFFYSGSYSNDATGAGETALLRRSALAGLWLEARFHLFGPKFLSGDTDASATPKAWIPELIAAAGSEVRRDDEVKKLRAEVVHLLQIHSD
jgi:hypothetical protein